MNAVGVTFVWTTAVELLDEWQNTDHSNARLVSDGVGVFSMIELL